MRFTINGACASDTGKIRKNNEDNFFFCGTHLPAIHSGTNKSRHFEVTLRRREIMAVFDGMGGENFGEEASHAAALRLCRVRNSLLPLIYPHKEFLSRSIIEMNQAVVEKKREFYTEQMGTTFVMRHLSGTPYGFAISATAEDIYSGTGSLSRYLLTMWKNLRVSAAGRLR